MFTFVYFQNKNPFMKNNIPPPPPPEMPKASVHEETDVGRSKRKKALFPQHKRVWLICLFSLTFLIIGLYVLNRTVSQGSLPESPPVSSDQKIIPVHVMGTKSQRFQDIMMTVGTITGGSKIDLKFEVDGKIMDFDYENGHKVEKEAIIARLNQEEADIKCQQAELALLEAQKMVNIGALEKTRLKEAQLAYQLAQMNFKKTFIRAPREGIIGNKLIDVGEFVSAGQIIATLVNIETVFVEFGVVEKELDKILPNQQVIITVDTYPGIEFTGQIERIDPIVGPTRTMSAKARLKNQGGFLLPGMFARTRVIIYEDDNAIVVPNEALEKTPAGHQVYVVTKDNKAMSREVHVGYFSVEFAQILNGLTPGERVVIQKPQKLRNNMAVKIIHTQ